MSAVGLAAAVGVFARGELDPLPTEVLARTSPNLLDLGIAGAAGAAGAYSYVRKQASDALAGAAVAVALVPPLSVVGLMLQLGEFRRWTVMRRQCNRWTSRETMGYRQITLDRDRTAERQLLRRLLEGGR